MIAIPEAAWGGIAGAVITAFVSVIVTLFTRAAARREKRLDLFETKLDDTATKEQAAGLAGWQKEHETRDNTLFEGIRTHIEAVEVRLRGEIRDSKVDILTVLRETFLAPQPRTAAAARRRKRATSEQEPQER